jgi:hypothetical protein
MVNFLCLGYFLEGADCLGSSFLVSSFLASALADPE